MKVIFELFLDATKSVPEIRDHLLIKQWYVLVPIPPIPII